MEPIEGTTNGLGWTAWTDGGIALDRPATARELEAVRWAAADRFLSSDIRRNLKPEEQQYWAALDKGYREDRKKEKRRRREPVEGSHVHKFLCLRCRQEEILHDCTCSAGFGVKEGMAATIYDRPGCPSCYRSKR